MELSNKLDYGSLSRINLPRPPVHKFETDLDPKP